MWKGNHNGLCLNPATWRASITGLICGYHFTKFFIVVVQKLDLQKVSIEEDIDCSNVKGQIVISLAGRDRGGCGPNVTDVSLMSRSDMDGCCSQISPEIIPRNNSLPHGLVRVYQVRHCQCIQSHATLVYE